LLDEIEKANPDVFNVLLQLLDDGRLTDGQGRTVDFTNAVLIMTSNLGSEYIDPDLPAVTVNDRVMEAVKGHFRPEFLNRIDDIVVFDRLSRDDLREIVEIQLKTLEQRLGQRRIDVAFDDEALHLLAQRGYDPVYGARPLKRLIQTDVADKLARGLLDGTFVEGQSIKVSVEGGELVFS